MKDKLIELLHDSDLSLDSVRLAEYLLEHGVKVPPCWIGDKVYEKDGVRIYESTIKQVVYDAGGLAFDARAIGRSVFLTREEAEQALKGGAE